MTYKEYLLAKIAQESSELAQAASKIALFGESGVDPTDPKHVNNLHQLMQEWTKVQAVIAVYLEGASDTATYKACPYPAERLNKMQVEATLRLASQVRALKSNLVITD